MTRFPKVVKAVGSIERGYELKCFEIYGLLTLSAKRGVGADVKNIEALARRHRLQNSVGGFICSLKGAG